MSSGGAEGLEAGEDDLAGGAAVGLDDDGGGDAGAGEGIFPGSDDFADAFVFDFNLELFRDDSAADEFGEFVGENDDAVDGVGFAELDGPGDLDVFAADFDEVAAVRAGGSGLPGAEGCGAVRQVGGGPDSFDVEGAVGADCRAEGDGLLVGNGDDFRECEDFASSSSVAGFDVEADEASGVAVADEAYGFSVGVGEVTCVLACGVEDDWV